MRTCQATTDGRLLGVDNPHSSLTCEQVSDVRRLRRAGLTYARIAAEVGCCLASAQKIATGKMRGQVPARTLVRVTQDDAPRVAELHALGNGYENIAKILGTTRSSVQVLLRQVKQELRR